MANQFINFCPSCGKKVKEIKSNEKLIKGVDESFVALCTNKKCTYSDVTTPLRIHHPYNGTYAAPGDSWSLSWIK